MAEFGAQLKARGAESVEVIVGRKDEIAIAFWASQNWRQRVKVYSRSPLPPVKLDHPSLAVHLRAIVESYSVTVAQQQAESRK